LLRAQTKAATIQAEAAQKQVASADQLITILQEQLAAAGGRSRRAFVPMLFIPAQASSLPTLTKVEMENQGRGPAMETTAAYARFGDTEIKHEFFVGPGPSSSEHRFLVSSCGRAFSMCFLVRTLVNSGNWCGPIGISQEKAVAGDAVHR
jgi:hypothetical protein